MNLSDTAIPIRINLGVTGHRSLDDEPAYTRKISGILDKIEQMLPPLKCTPVVFTILSPLAEGADRIVAREILKREKSQLIAVLPFEVDVYTQDFVSATSREEFHEFLSKASKVILLPEAEDKNEAYARAGRYVVNNCDILIALWDGNERAGRGGTAEIVQYARTSRCPLFWMNTASNGDKVFEKGMGLNRRAYMHLEGYNTEEMELAKIDEETRKHGEALKRVAQETHFSSVRLSLVEEKLLPRFVRTDLLAEKYQNLYFKAGTWVYILAAAAVAAVTFQILFLPHRLSAAWIEIFCILGIIAIYGIGNFKKWHSKWIDYRFLAERFRSAIYLALSGMNVTAMRPPRHLSLSYSSQDWMVSAFSAVWSELPRLDTKPPPEFAAQKALLEKAWVDKQIDYHKKTARQHQRRSNILVYAGNSLFGLTLLVALCHVFHIGPALANTLFGFLAIVFPATGAALGAIRTHREYLRNAKRSGEMVRHLEELKKQLQAADNPEQFFHLVREIEVTMLHENEDWRVVVRFHELEPPA